MAKKEEKRLRIMVSSTVHGIKPALNQIYAQLDGYGYEVWMSAAGTIPNFSKNHAFTDCLKAVENCDLFFSLITPRYGSVVDDVGITHQELSKAIECQVPRWVMVHERVTLVRSFFVKLGFKNAAMRRGLLDSLGYDDADKYSQMVRREASVIDDFRVIDMFDLASQQNIAPKDRVGNWVQPFSHDEEIRRYVNTQFGDYAAMKKQIDMLGKAKPSPTERGPRK